MWLGAVIDSVQAGVVPDVTVEGSTARRAAHVKGHAGRVGLRGIVPADYAGIGNGRPDGEGGIDLHAKAHHGAGARLQITINGGIVRREHRTRIGHPGRGAVQGARSSHIGHLIAQGRTQIIGHRDADGRQTADVVHPDDILQLPSGLGGAATDNQHLLGHGEQLGSTHDDDGGLTAVGRHAIGIGQFRGQLVGGDAALIGDESSRGHTTVDPGVKGDHGGFAGRDNADTRIVAGLHRQSNDQR